MTVTRRLERVLATLVAVAMLWLLRPAAPRWPGATAADAVTTDSLRWPHRATVGDAIVMRGPTPRDSQRVVLIGPDGRADSTRAAGSFAVAATAPAAGHWSWTLRRGGRTDTLGVDVRERPALRVLIVEARPSFETAALARRLAAQGASVTVRTRLTAHDERTATWGPDAPPLAMHAAALDRLDALVFGPGAVALLPDGERTAVRDAVRRGLGLLHLIDSTAVRGPLFPFAASSRGLEAEAVHPVLDGRRLASPVRAAPLVLSGGATLTVGEGGAALSVIAREGHGAIAATRVLTPSRWTLAGDDSLAAAWWAAQLGAVLRAARAEWRVADDLRPTVDERLVVERIGDITPFARLREADGTVDSVPLVPVPGDSLRRRAALWPVAPGWLALAAGDDTLHLLVRPPAERGVLPDPGPGPARWWPWAVLLAACAVLWRRR